MLVWGTTGDGTRIFRENWVNTIAADALAPCVARSSAAMALTMQDKQILVFHKAGFLLSVPCKCLEMSENVDKFLKFVEIDWAWQGLMAIGIDHDTVCPWVVCAATPGTARVGRPLRGRLRPRQPAHECCAGSGSTNHDSADRMSGQFLFYHENEAKHNDKSHDGHDDERHAESPWLTTPLWWWKRP